MVLFNKWSQTLVFLKNVYVFYKCHEMALDFTSPAQFNTKSTKPLQNIRAESLNGSNKYAFQLYGSLIYKNLVHIPIFFFFCVRTSGTPLFS